ncbi:MAG TPA: PEP-CTERM sorting domain-containing protein, partial [Pirellulales bacterium]
GTLTTGTGTLTINRTGALYVDDFTGMFTGTLNANGDITVNGGQFVAGTGFNWASGKTLTIENGSNVTFNGAYATVANATYNISDANSSLQMISSLALGNGANVNVSSGASIGATGFNIGSGTAGTLSVDGAGSAASGSGGTTAWGTAGGTANVTFSNSAAGNFHRTMGFTTMSLAGSATAGTTAHVTVESGATVTTNNLLVAAAGGATTAATLDITGIGSAVTVDSMAVGNATTDTAAVNVLSGGTLTVSGATANGTTTLNHTGSITINGGTFNTGGLTNNSGTFNFISGTLGITGTSGLTIGSSGPLGNNMALGSGQTLNVTNATTIDAAAALTLNAGTLNTGSVILNSTSTMNIGLGGTTRGSQYGDVVTSGNASLAGALYVSVFNGFTLAAGNRFDIFDWSTHSGTFASVTLPTLSGSLVWNTSLLYTSGVLRVVDPNFLPGDMNLDHHINAADVLPMEQALANLSSYKATYVPGITNAHLALIDDVDGDGSFTNADLQTLLIDLKNGGGSADPVPEPAAIVLLGLGALAFAIQRRARYPI